MGKREEVGRELESMEKFLGTRNLEGGPCHETPKEERISHMFENLIDNTKLHNGVKL